MSSPKIVTKKITTKMNGIEYNTSTTRIIKLSTHPPRYPAIAPYETPITSDTSVATNPTNSETRAPQNTRANKSRPNSSRPHKLLSDHVAEQFNPQLHQPTVHRVDAAELLVDPVGRAGRRLHPLEHRA